MYIFLINHKSFVIVIFHNLNTYKNYIYGILSRLFDILSISRMNPFGLIVALNSSYQAKGSLYWDDGDSLGK